MGMSDTKARRQKRDDRGGVPKTVVSYTFPQTLADEVRAAARESGLSASAFLATVLSQNADMITPITQSEKGGAHVKHAA